MGKLSRSVLKKTPKAWVKNSVFSFQLVRSLTFLSQSLSLPLFELLLTGKARQTSDPQFLENLQKTYADLLRLLQKDAEQMARGVYPIDVLKPESAKNFFTRYPKIIADGINVSKRRKAHKAHDFSAEAGQYLRDVPEYFQRNFHFQTGGYLTKESAELYEHQVEILFSGAADAMRRLLLPMLKNHFPYSEGEGLHFLEIGAGTGRLSRFVKLTFPKAQITVLDISPPYLKKAQENLSGFERVNFILGDAADLPFKEQRFDAVYSCFLFHELPFEVRGQVLRESFRVLKDKGFIGLVDSVQMQDKPEVNWALKQFPLDFHEPFFKNYVQNPMEGLLQSAGFKEIYREIGFFSKALSAIKVLKLDQ